ncbi:MAG: hypothetical protein GTO40_14090, partial [Deltaproteobacteria bacterium]|nr:hypothetical protein [Deltaproteobacteria bacterium]
FAYKVLRLDLPFRPEAKANLWTVEARITFEARGEPIKVSMFIPRNTRRFGLVDERFISRGYGLTTTAEDTNRQAVWAIRMAKGHQNLYYQ